MVWFSQRSSRRVTYHPIGSPYMASVAILEIGNKNLHPTIYPWKPSRHSPRSLQQNSCHIPFGEILSWDRNICNPKEGITTLSSCPHSESTYYHYNTSTSSFQSLVHSIHWEWRLLCRWLAYNPFLILINTPLIINNKSGTPNIPHEHFKRGCTNFKRSQTIMN